MAAPAKKAPVKNPKWLDDILEEAEQYEFYVENWLDMVREEKWTEFQIKHGLSDARMERLMDEVLK